MQRAAKHLQWKKILLVSEIIIHILYIKYIIPSVLPSLSPFLFFVLPFHVNYRMCVGTLRCHHGLLVEVREQFSGLSFLLPPGPRDWAQVVSLGGKHFYPLSHLWWPHFSCFIFTWNISLIIHLKIPLWLTGVASAVFLLCGAGLPKFAKVSPRRVVDSCFSSKGGERFISCSR